MAGVENEEAIVEIAAARFYSFSRKYCMRRYALVTEDRWKTSKLLEWSEALGQDKGKVNETLGWAVALERLDPLVVNLHLIFLDIRSTQIRAFNSYYEVNRLQVRT